MITTAKSAEIQMLNQAYSGCVVKYGEMHNHTAAGPQADGWHTLAQWAEEMQKLGMSFATIVDHKQVAHMYHDDWRAEPELDKDGNVISDIVFIGGSEPGTHITDIGATQDSLHYNMIINDPQKMLDILRSNGEFVFKEFATYADYCGNGYNDTNNKAMLYDPTEYSADSEGVLRIFSYPRFTKAGINALTKAYYDAGGLLVHAHPKYLSYLVSDNPLDYFFGEDATSQDGAAMGFEIHTCSNKYYDPSFVCNEDAYQTWIQMLRAGKKAYATYGNDNHRLPTAHALTTVYVPERANSDVYMSHIHSGNITAGWVGIRMKLGEAVMGGLTSFQDQRLIFSVGDMYKNAYATETTPTFDPSYNPEHEYVVQLYDETGVLMEETVDPGQMTYFAVDARKDARYYRVVVWDKTAGYRCAVGNPIWNCAK